MYDTHCSWHAVPFFLSFSRVLLPLLIILPLYFFKSKYVPFGQNVALLYIVKLGRFVWVILFRISQWFVYAETALMCLGCYI